MSALAAGVVGLAVLLAGRRSPRTRPTALRESVPGTEDQALLRRLQAPLAVLAAVAGWTVLGGWAGAGAGLVGGVVCWRVLGQVESPAVVRRREALERDLPLAVYLLGASLGSGASMVSAVLVVAEALPGPIAEELRKTHHRLVLGLDPAAVWRGVPAPLRPLGRALERAHASGASVRGAVDSLAEDLRSGARARAEALARTVEVRAAAPLGVCFLPAFVLLGIVPMTVGIFSSIRLF